MQLTDDPIAKITTNSIITRSGATNLLNSQVEMVLGLIKPIILRQASSVEVKASSEREFDLKLHHAIDQTVHSSLCGSVCFYLNLFDT